MPKPERGLPQGFDIKVPERPVSLGDYLDEQPLGSSAEPKEPSRRATPPEGKAPIGIDVPPVQPPAAAAPSVRDSPAVIASPSAPLPALAPPAVVASKRRLGPARKQLNLTPETLRMLEELVVEIRTRSAERDVRASEVLHSLVLLANDVRPLLDLDSVGPRGQWGSSTAAALPFSLRDAFRRAIGKWQGR